MAILGVIITGFFATGCADRRAPTTIEPGVASPLVVAVAPVLNLSNSTDWDPVKVTDMLASELQSLPGVVVIPVNRTLAALELMGRDAVETPQDALELAAEFNADTTLVTAITEYNPYEPPIVGVIMQWYAPPRDPVAPAFDPVSASRQAADIAPAAAAEVDPTTPLVQVQRVYNAADDEVLAEVRAYAAHRRGHGSPDGWRAHVRSQERFVRFCLRSTLIRPIRQLQYRAACTADGMTP
jgi:hypothetical protein